MDDFTLGGSEDVIDQHIAMVTGTGANLGLNISTSASVSWFTRRALL